MGAVKPRPIDVRFIAATNRDLEAEVAQGTFRRDLFFRLNGITLTIPPLRERKDEIAALVETFVADACRESGRERPPTLTAEAMGYILDYDWPGNIRELKNVIERALVLCDGDEITPQFLPLDKMSDISPTSLRLEESGAGQMRAAESCVLAGDLGGPVAGPRRSQEGGGATKHPGRAREKRRQPDASRRGSGHAAPDVHHQAGHLRHSPPAKARGGPLRPHRAHPAHPTIATIAASRIKVRSARAT